MKILPSDPPVAVFEFGSGAVCEVAPLRYGGYRSVMFFKTPRGGTIRELPDASFHDDPRGDFCFGKSTPDDLRRYGITPEEQRALKAWLKATAL